MIVKINDTDYTCHVKYSKRKSIEIGVTPSGDIRLKVPLRTSDKSISDIIKKKSDWLIEKLALVANNTISKRQYVSGETILYLGQPIYVQIKRRDVNRLQISMVENEVVIVVATDTGNEEIKDLLIGLYKKLLKALIISRIDFYQSRFDKRPSRVTIRDQKTRWGSCSSRASLNFNYRLLMAPIEIIDYIVVHEMCHMDYMDHSKEYWQRVKEVMPDYLKYENWLKDNGKYLNFDYTESL